MTLQKHDLVHEFPEHRERIHTLKMSDAHFARLFNEYHELDQRILHIEQELETPGDAVVESLKQRRVQLKDALYARLQAA